MTRRRHKAKSRDIFGGPPLERSHLLFSLLLDFISARASTQTRQRLQPSIYACVRALKAEDVAAFTVAKAPIEETAARLLAWRIVPGGRAA